jgi:hypothetical protein
LNERHQFEEAEAWLRRSRREFAVYVEGLPEASELLRTLDRIGEQVGSEWATLGRQETFVMARQVMRAKFDMRERAPQSYTAALDVDDEFIRPK